MKSTHEILHVITYRFPNHKDLIKELFQQSSSFQTLCEDYYECKKMLEKFTKINNKNGDIKREYQTLLAEIEEEFSQRFIT